MTALARVLTPGICAGLLLAGTVLEVRAELIEITYDDGPNFGFHDSTPVDPAPGNPATTLGEQRRTVFEAAVDIWATRLDGLIPVRIEARFDDLGCGEEAFFGWGGTTGIARNFNNTPETDISFPLSQAVALSGQYFSGFSTEMFNEFNFRLDSEDCIPGIESYWYGLDPEIPPAFGTVSFLSLALHELGHGLGMVSLTNSDTREFIGNPPRPGIMSTMIFSLSHDQSWAQMTAPQRKASDTSGDNLIWTGEQVNQRGAERLLPPGRASVSPPIQGTAHFPAFMHGFLPFIPLEGMTREVALADGPGPDADVAQAWQRALACEPLDNADEVEGRFVLVKRAECPFATKWQNAFDAGAAGVILVDNLSPSESGALTRDGALGLDRNLPIPIWSVSRDTGNSFRTSAPDGIEVTLGYELDQEPRGTRDGFVNIQASPDTQESNISHFSNDMFPPSLMGTGISGLVYSGDLDLAADFMLDIGWWDDSGKLDQYAGSWYNPDRSGEGCMITLEGSVPVPVLTCYMYRQQEQLWLIGTGVKTGNRFEFDELTVTEGTDFGSGFDADDIIRSDWGKAVVRLIDCNQARFDFEPRPDQGLPPLSSHMQKVVPGQCNLRSDQHADRLHTGVYYDPARSGEGIHLALEADAESWVVAFYTYLDGDQAWLIGNGQLNGDQIRINNVQITSGADYGQNFDPDDVDRIRFGAMTLQFDGCNDMTVTIESDLPQFESGQRSMERTVRIDC